ncbi:hypothetical protein L8106_01257 [Lyngbya sp. PCC 8106]|nr:hypothetical protein L8106_01257 [Lyngbya sp. PCC 8106]
MNQELAIAKNPLSLEMGSMSMRQLQAKSIVFFAFDQEKRDTSSVRD